MSNFSAQLKTGKAGESQIAKWLISRGMNILPVYEIADGQHKGPAVYSAKGGEIIAPDLLAFGNGKAFWIEAKHKNAFSMHRITNRWVTGIDLHHYSEYQRINDLVDWPVWILFLHRQGKAKNSPDGCPSGLFGNDIEYLMKNENHRHLNHGKTGMVYWSTAALKHMAPWPLQ